jgi:hypothetical protein
MWKPRLNHIWDLWWTTWHWSRFISRKANFLLSIIILPIPQNQYASPGAGTIVPSMSTVPRESVSPEHHPPLPAPPPPPKIKNECTFLKFWSSEKYSKYKHIAEILLK